MPPVPPAPEPIRYNPPSSMQSEKEKVEGADPTQALEADGEKAALAKIDKKKKGRKSTILTGPQGLTTEADIYNPTLLG